MQGRADLCGRGRRGGLELTQSGVEPFCSDIRRLTVPSDRSPSLTSTLQYLRAVGDLREIQIHRERRLAQIASHLFELPDLCRRGRRRLAVQAAPGAAGGRMVAMAVSGCVSAVAGAKICSSRTVCGLRGVHDDVARPQHERALELLDLGPRAARQKARPFAKSRRTSPVRPARVASASSLSI